MEAYQREYVNWLENQAKYLYVIYDDELVECDFSYKIAFISIWKVKKGRKVECRKCFSLSADDLLRIIALYADSETYAKSYGEYAKIYKTYFP